MLTSGTRNAAAQPRKTRPYAPRTALAVTIGWSDGSASLIAHPPAAPSAAPVQSRPTYDSGRPVDPIRRLSDRRSSSISTHPATPAEAVSPAAPHIALIPSHRGSGIAQV